MRPSTAGQRNLLVLYSLPLGALLLSLVFLLALVGPVLSMAATTSSATAAWQTASNTHTRTLALVAGAAAALYAAYSVAHLHLSEPAHTHTVDAAVGLFGRQTTINHSHAHAQTKSKTVDTARVLGDIPTRAGPPPAYNTWHPFARHAPREPTAPAFRARATDRLSRAATRHGLELAVQWDGCLVLRTRTHPPTPGQIVLPALDDSLRVALHPADAMEVVARGWGVRDGQAAALVFPPRNDEELSVVLEILGAGVEYLRDQAAEELCNEILDIVL